MHFRSLAGLENGGRVNGTPNYLAALGGIDADAAGIMLGSLEDSGLMHRGYDLWVEVEVLRLGDETEGLREEGFTPMVSRALPRLERLS